MTHLPFIAASYALALLVLGGFGTAAWIRLAAARRMLGVVDPRRSAAQRHSANRQSANRPPVNRQPPDRHST
jgi:hypothetical protein